MRFINIKKIIISGFLIFMYFPVFAENSQNQHYWEFDISGGAYFFLDGTNGQTVKISSNRNRSTL